jgi:Xaa-Pro aminopeptidase
VEPGCYIRPGEGIPPGLAGIGVRIEDDVLVAEHGNEILTQDAPKAIAEIEGIMARRDG